MWAMTRKGHVVEYSASCARCLKVNRDLRLRLEEGDAEKDAVKGCDEDILNGEAMRQDAVIEH